MRRLRPYFAIAAALLAGVLIEAQGTPPAAPLILLTPAGRRPIPTTILNGQELVSLDDVASLFQVSVREDALARGVTVTYKGRTIVASPEQPMASVNGRLVSLPSPVTRVGQRWLVPVEFISRALSQIYDSRIELRKPSRLLIVGNLRVPRVTARVEPAGTATRVVIDAAPATDLTTTHDASRVTVRLAADALDVRLPVPGAGLVEQIRAGDQPATMVVALRGPATVSAATSVVDGGTRLTIELQPPGTQEAPGPSAPAQAPPAPDIPFLSGPRPTLQTIVIDPGHGGEDRGAAGAGGVVEKDVTLEVARRLKTLVEARLGIRVVLTREDDRRVGLDQRAAIANNSKADLFVSLHANASFVPGVSGAEVLYLALDEEIEAAQRAALADSVTLPVLGGGTRTLDVLRWDMAQARHLESSATLGVLLEEELRSRVPMSPQPLQRAPLRVLMGVNMPAVLVEMAYLTNAEQAQRAASADFQTAVAQAIYETVLRFRTQLEAAR